MALASSPTDLPAIARQTCDLRLSDRIAEGSEPYRCPKGKRRAKIDSPPTPSKNRSLRLDSHIFSGAPIPSNPSARTNSRSTTSVIPTRNARFSASLSVKMWCL